MTAFFAAMTLNPEVQNRAQVEIDTIIGRERKPRVEDQTNLPYTLALIQEVLRFAPPAPLGALGMYLAQQPS